MKFIKNFRVFENLRGVKKSLLESEIDLVELEHILIDFKQMGLDYDIKAGSSIVIDWNLFNDDKTGGSKCLNSGDIDKYTKSRTGNSLTIELNSLDRDGLVGSMNGYNIEDTKEAYEMLKDYLFDNYDLIPNYIYVNYHWSYMYFEDLDKIKENIPLNTAKLGSKDPNIFKAHKLVLAFYKN
jgi:hypothetical protein